ncbi:MAG: arginine deiminase family protein [Pseudomonadota bacterium]|nr:arginine deiminase family protein [Pseudomonadota bacterium]
MFYDFSNAIVRQPCRRVSDGLREGVEKPRYGYVKAEHQNYVELLKALGLKVYELRPDDNFPDSMFVEDPAFTLANFAVLLNPGAETREGEKDLIKDTLKELFSTFLTVDEGTVEGGDVLILEKEVLIGLSSRTNFDGASALQAILRDQGYESRIVETPKNVLHLKSECSALDEETILATPRIAFCGLFNQYNVILTHKNEFVAANSLRINDKLLVPNSCPHTADQLSKRFDIEFVKVSEVAKIDAGLSCMSLRW